MGRVALPELRRYKYSDTLDTGTIAAGGVLGILIPPSVILIIYSIIVEANVVTMFAAALTTGLIAVVLFICTILVYVTIVPDAGPRGALPERGEFIDATLGILLAALIVLGCLMDSLSMILLTIPFFWPVFVELNGGDWATAADSPFGVTTEELKIWFGVLALIVVELGLITPPVGMNVFIISAQAPQVPMRRTFLGVLPFFGAEIVRVGVLVAFPVVTLWLPRVLGG